MNMRAQWMFWLGFTGLFFLTIHVFKAVLLPFVLGMAIAYLLNPVVNKLSNFGFSRIGSTIVILGSFFIVVMGILVAVLPVLYQELVKLSEDLPTYIDQAIVFLDPIMQNAMGIAQVESSADLKALLVEHIGSAMNVAKSVWGGVSAGGAAFASFVSLLVITPITAFFMMVEWPKMTRWVQDLFPRDHEKTIMNLFKEIDKKLAGFVRGQISVAFILGVAYAIALSIAGLKYGILIGFTSGLLSIIPMVGSTVGLLTSIAVAFFQTGDWQFVLLIGGIFVVGQIIEGNFLTPKLVGDSVGLHPMWIFFALIAGGSLFGILGMLLAVPVAAVISVLLAFGLLKYKASSLYKGKKNKASRAKPKTVRKKRAKVS